jgi:biotin carboxyl carrier protein
LNYKVRSGSKSHRLQIEKNQDFTVATSILVGKKDYRVKVQDKTPAGELRSLAINNRIYSVQVRRRPDGFPYKVILNGRAYPVEIERVESTRYKPPVAPRKINGRITATLPGQIREILVSPGDSVKKGQPLLTLEAMKMENEIESPIDGVVQTLGVDANQLVLKGDLLIEVVEVDS